MSNLLKSKFLLGVMIVAVMFVGAFAFTANAEETNCTITATLRVGSTGADVICLQSKIGATADGKFGPMTKAKVVAYQSNHALTADGVVGAKTRAALMAEQVDNATFPAGCTSATGFSSTTGLPCSTVTTYPAGCTSTTGFSSTTGLPCSGTVVTFPAGCTSAVGFSSTTGLPCSAVVVAGNTDGSISASQSSYVSSGIQVKKGETKDIAAVRLQAVVGPVKVTRVDAEFNVRPWLFFNQVTLHDNMGKVLATKTLSSIADVTEITVGSLYQVRFDGLDYKVTPGTNPDLAVSASVLAATDKIPSGGQSVTTTISSIRTTSEIGYYDTVYPISPAGVNTVTLTSTGAVASLFTRISPSSPVAGQQVVSLTATTYDVLLGGFSVKSTNNSSTLNTLTVTVAGDAAVNTSTKLSNFRLFVGGVSVAGGALNGANVTFSNLTVPLALDAWTDLMVKADVAQNTSGTVWLTMNASTGMVITDANYATPIYNAATPATNVLTLTASSVVLSNATATLGSAIIQGNATVGYNATYAFTLTNSSNTDLFVSATPSTFVTTSITGTTTTGTALTNATVSPATVNGDTASVYAIPAGTARTFSFSAVLRGAAASTTVFKVTQINYSSDATLTPALTITTGLSALTLVASF